MFSPLKTLIAVRSSKTGITLRSKISRSIAAMAFAFLAPAALVAGFAGQPALAQTEIGTDWNTRGYYGVANLTPGDTLNVRTSASAKSPIVGELSQGTIVFATGKVGRRKSAPWYEINHSDGEGLAWVSSKFLERREVKTLAQTRAPQAGSCSGFEPGWEVSWNQTGIKASTMMGLIGSAQFSSVITPGGVTTPSVVEFRNNPAALRFTLVLEDRICTALPTDSAHYQSGLLLVEKNGTLSAYSGCCNPAPQAIGFGG